IDSVTDAAAALVGFAAVRSGIANSTTFNSNLANQASLLMQNARALDIYSSAAEAMGGSKQGVLSDVSRMSNDYLARGITPPKYEDWLKRVGENLKGIQGEAAKRNYIGRLGYATDAGTVYGLLHPDVANKEIASATAINKKTEDDYKNSQETVSLLSRIDQNISNIWTKISSFLGSDVSAAITSPVGAAGGVVTALAGRNILKRLLGGAAATAATGTAAVGGVGVLGALGLAGVGAAGGYGLANLIAYGIDKAGIRTSKWHREHDAPLAKGARGASSMQFWMSQGYTKEQAAGMVANELAESGGDPTARGDGGRAHGLFQWHPDRVAKILKGTGIDVRTAGHEDQLRAAAWELKARGQDKKLKSISGAYEAGAFISDKFEIPADMTGEAIKRGKSALSLASNYGNPASSSTKNVTVKIDNIEVKTQATEAAGIANEIGSHLSKTLGYIAANNDDGIAY
ncbi:MAG: hypothetical protein B7Z23_09520, partial [Pseudomonadales bacterium 32-61-5]